MRSVPFDGIRWEALKDRGTAHTVQAVDEQVQEARARLRDTFHTAEILNCGSTSPDRATFVADPTTPYQDFRPDVDLNILVGPKVDRAKVLEVTEEVLDDLGLSLARGAHRYTDHQHNKDVINAGQNGIVLSAAVFTPTAEEKEALRYHEIYGRSISHDQRIESKVLRLTLQRSAAYGSYNRALSGLCIDELIRQHGDLDTALRFLHTAAHDGSKRKLTHPITGKNLLNSISGAVWDRIAIVTKHYLQTNEFPSGMMTPTRWDELNPGRFTTVGMVWCGIESCGREPHEVAGLVLQRSKQVMKELRLPGPFDYYLVPCAPSSLQIAHTSVLISLPNFNHLHYGDVRREFHAMLRKIEE